MNIIFSLRLDKETSQRLQLLADTTHFSRGGVVRWLINGVAIPSETITPLFRDPSINTGIPEMSPQTRQEDVEVSS